MVDPAVLVTFETFTQRLLDAVSARPEVLGLVLLGSTADRRRVDEWSDHDFFLITTEGAQERLRRDLDWLPDQDRIGFAARETAHGLKVVYVDGAVLEFAVASPAELSTFAANAYEVVLDRADVAERMRRVAAREVPATDDLVELRLFLALVLIGVGRDRRGEHLVVGQFLRAHATGHLLAVLRHRLPASGPDVTDDLDAWRRFEQAYPAAGAEVVAAHARAVEDCGRALLAVADRYLAPGWPDYPVSEVALVRRRLGW